MIKGLFISEDGFVQLIGEVSSLVFIIRTIKNIIPDLEQKERDRINSILSNEDLEKLLQERKKNKMELSEP